MLFLNPKLMAAQALFSLVKRCQVKSKSPFSKIASNLKRAGSRLQICGYLWLPWSRSNVVENIHTHIYPWGAQL
jgi:hypothetical protein